MTFVKPAELERLRALSDSNDIRLYVLAGPDEASVTALNIHMLNLATTDSERIALNATELRDDPMRLTSEACALSLFSTARIINLTINGAGEEALAAIKMLLVAEKTETPVIATATDLTRKSRLGKLVETDARARLVQCYQPMRRDLIRIAIAAATAHSLHLGKAEAEILIDMVAGDRALLGREIEKIALYCDATPNIIHSVTATDISAIGAATYDEDINACVNATMVGDMQQLPEIFSRMEAIGITEIRLIRAFARRALLIAKLSGEMARGKTARTLVADRRYAIFWKEQDAVAAQLRLWDSARCAQMNRSLLDCERALKSSASVGGVIFRKLMSDIARRAAVQARKR